VITTDSENGTLRIDDSPRLPSEKARSIYHELFHQILRVWQIRMDEEDLWRVAEGLAMVMGQLIPHDELLRRLREDGPEQADP